jgi:3',5'-cyclic AMP phosphodiesterase CpdA
VRTPGSTLVTTLADVSGNGVLAPAGGERLVPRTELAPAGRVVRTLATFAQISDAHVTDEESPLRLEVLDRLGGRLSSAFRPQESLTAQVLAAAEVSVNALRPAVVLVTGDLVDNAQRNELDWALRILRGGAVTPDSGGRGYQGVQGEASADPFIYRPSIDAPRHPGLLAAAQRTFRAPGLRAPWLPLVSNHDLLVQGNLPADPRLERIAIGSRKLVEPSTALLAAARSGGLDARRLDRFLSGNTAGVYRSVTADPSRRPLSPVGAARRIAAGAGMTLRHGLLVWDRRLALGVRLIGLDTANRAGGAVGRLPGRELRWFGRRLRADAGSHLVVVSPTPLEDTRGGRAALRLLDRAHGVVAVLSGDTHRNLITPHPTGRGGYWLVRAPSLADYPQQVRAYRLVALADGRIALETWMLDQAGVDRASGYLGLAGVSRDLAYLDVQGGRPRGWAGTRLDRNALLFLPGTVQSTRNASTTGTRP